MKIGIVGASGNMGNGIAQVFSMYDGYEIYLAGTTAEKGQAGIEKIRKTFQKRVDKGKMEQSVMDSALAKISAGDISICADCDLVIEARSEDMEIKKATFAELDKICKPECIFASNTSSLSITEMDTFTEHVLIGMHFFNPAPVMKLVEVVYGLNTKDEVIDWAMDLCTHIGKTPVRVKEGPGFVVNRILLPMINEGITIFAEGLASRDDVDAAMKLGANHPMGPLELADLIGLDVCLAVLNVLYSEFGDQKYRPHPLLVKMVRGGKLGRKTKHGFYDYE